MTSPGYRFVGRLFPLTILLLFCLGSLTGGKLTLLPVAEFELEAEEGSGANPGADEMYYEMRAYPLKAIPLGARARAIEQLEETEARQLRRREQLYGARAAAVIAQRQPKWEALGPRPIANGNTGAISRAVAGRATAVALAPGYDGVNNQTLYVGAAQGGVWKSGDNGAHWTPLFDEQPSLAIGSLAIDPTNPNVIYAGTGEGNFSADSYYGQGLFKSVDGGATWRQIVGPTSTIAPLVPAFQGIAILRIVLDPHNPQTLYLCTRNAAAASAQNGGSVTGFGAGQRGVWKSIDGGLTWRNLNPANLGAAYTATDLAISPQDSNVILAGLPGRGIYRSQAGGEPGAWERLSGGLPDGTYGRIGLTVGPPLPPATTPTFCAVISDNADGLHGVYRSVDNGNTWLRAPGLPASIGQTNYNLTLSVDPQNADILYLGLVSFFRSVNGGATWSEQANGNGNGGLHVDQHCAVVAPDKPNLFFIANDGGIWRSENANDASAPMGWLNLNTTLDTVQFQGVAVHPTNPDFLVGGTQDNGTNRFTGDPAWTRIFGGDGGYALIDQSNPNIIWQSTQSSARSATAAPSFGPRVSSNGGNSFTDRGCRANCQAVAGSMNPGDRVRFYSVMALHTGFTQPNLLYWGTQRVYRSADLGLTWTGLGPSADGFGLDLSRGAGTVTAIAAHPKLDASTTPPGELVWVATSDGNIQVTTNAGKLADAVFTRVDKAPLPGRVPVEIALDPNDTRRAYVVYSGFNLGTPSAPGHVFVTEDLGQTWRDISGDLPDIPVTSIAPDAQQAGTLYLGTDIGVFQTTDGGATWVRLGNGMPRVATFMLRYHAATRSLVAATHGRGMFRLKLAAPVVTVSSANFRRESLAVEGIASAFGANLATRTEAARSVPLPTELAGTTVRLTDANGLERLAPLFFVSAQQVNYQIPPEIAPGAITVTVTSGDGSVSFGIERARNVAPALFTANANGRGVPAGVGVRVSGGAQTFFTIARLDNSTNPPQYVPEAIELGAASEQVVLVLFGTGFRRRSALAAVMVTLGGVQATADYAGETPGLVGLDQLNFAIPRSLAGRGEVDVSVAANGVAANTVRVSIK